MLHQPNYADKCIVSCDFYEYTNQELLKLLFSVEGTNESPQNPFTKN